MLKINKALIGKKIRSTYNDHWYWNGATVIEATDREYGMNYLLLEKNGNSTWTSEPVVEVVEDTKKEMKEITQGIKKMEAMGFTVSKIIEDQFNRGLVRQFVKYDHKDRVTDIINFYYSKSVGVEVYANSLKYGGGSRLDKSLIETILLNLNELENSFD